MVHVEPNLRGQSRVEEPPHQGPSIVKGPKENPGEPLCVRPVGRSAPHGEEEGGRQSEQTRMATDRTHDPAEARGIPKIVTRSMALHGNAIPYLRPLFARHDHGVMSDSLQRLGEIPKVPPGLQRHLGGRQGLGENRNPQGFHGSAQPHGIRTGERVPGSVGNRPKEYPSEIRLRMESGPARRWRVTSLGTMGRSEVAVRADGGRLPWTLKRRLAFVRFGSASSALQPPSAHGRFGLSRPSWPSPESNWGCAFSRKGADHPRVQSDRARGTDSSSGRLASSSGPEPSGPSTWRSEEHTSELQSHVNLVCRLLLEKKKKKNNNRLLTKKKEQNEI